MSMASISAEGLVALSHGDAETGRDRFLSDRQVTGAFDQVLKKKVDLVPASRSQIST
jgi:hypothetical protein